MKKLNILTLWRGKLGAVNMQSIESILEVMTETGFETQFHATGHVKLSMITKVRTNE